ncbi:MAG: FAD:protein FMN transferase [bacterium]|nr:FAD:protein FMN transferase [bacterium]
MKKKTWEIGFFLILVLAIVLLFRTKKYTETQSMMDTPWEITVFSRGYPHKAFNSAFQTIHNIDSLAYFGGTGDIGRLNRGEKLTLSKDILEIIKQGIYVGKLTDGAFDITIRPVMELWKDFKKINKAPTQEEINKLLPLVNYKNIIINDSTVEFAQKGMKIDLSGIAKGYAVDLAVEKLKSAGIKTGMIRAGGQITVFGNKVWKIGIRNPRKSEVFKVLELKNRAVATSGDYERFFMTGDVRHHHIMNPKTGFSISDCISTTIITDKGVFSDALSTGVFVLGPEKGMALLDSLKIRGIIVTPDMRFLDNNL